MGVVSILTGEGHKIPGFSLSIWGDVPLGSGLSSSAALEVVTALAVLSLIGADYPRPVLARLCQRVENEFVGANCGIMDQFISANGKENHALLLDCRDLSFRLAPIPADVALVIANTMVKHSIAGGDYPTRRRESEAACAIINSHRGGVPFLRDATLDDLAKWGREMEPKSYLRAKHVISENLRTVAAMRGFVERRHEGSGSPDGRGAHQLQQGLRGQLRGGRSDGRVWPMSCRESSARVSPAAASAAAPSTWSSRTKPKPSPKS